MDDLLKVVQNRYEAVIVASREARRLNNLQRLSGSDQKTKVTVTALERLAKGDIKWEYGTVEDLKEDRQPRIETLLKVQEEEEEEEEGLGISMEMEEVEEVEEVEEEEEEEDPEPEE